MKSTEFINESVESLNAGHEYDQILHGLLKIYNKMATTNRLPLGREAMYFRDRFSGWKPQLTPQSLLRKFGIRLEITVPMQSLPSYRPFGQAAFYFIKSMTEGSNNTIKREEIPEIAKKIYAFIKDAREMEASE